MKSRRTFVPKRRRIEGKTDYNKRIKLLSSEKPRIIVRKSLSNMQGQIVTYATGGDQIVVSAHSRNLLKLGWKYGKSNIPAAYLTGFLLGTNAKKKGVEEAIADIGLQSSVKGNKLYAFIKGVIDAGVKVPVNEKVLPSADRISGKHIAEFAKKVKAEKGVYQFQFINGQKQNISYDDMPKAIETIKKKISEGAN